MGSAKVGRNQACGCGSGRKYKQCHGAKRQRMSAATWLVVVIAGAGIVAGIAFGVTEFNATPEPAAGRVWSDAHGHYH